MVGWPTAKCLTMSRTHTASWLQANKLRMRIRVGSANASNHSANTRASPGFNFADLTGGLGAFADLAFRDLVTAVGTAISAELKVP